MKRPSTPSHPAEEAAPASPPPAALTLARQQSDFTGEGSPPPGRVASSTPRRTAPPRPQGPARRRWP